MYPVFIFVCGERLFHGLRCGSFLLFVFFLPNLSAQKFTGVALIWIAVQSL